MSIIVNVAPKGIASQSSLSKWSKNDDASRALADDGRRDFSFHTDKETNPWWMVELDKIYLIESIKIINRRNSKFHNRARTLKVECSKNAEDWIVIHSGHCDWDRDLFFPLAGKFLAKFVKLSLEDTTYLHLSSVEIFVDMETEYAQNGNNNYFLFKMLRQHYVWQEHYRFIESYKAPERIKISEEPKIVDYVKNFFNIIRPYSVFGLEMIRVGGNRDGGYVMADPGNRGVAYSFGVSPHSPWDLEMANRGFEIFQYDGTIKAPPDLHPNMHFFKNNISGLAVPPPGQKTIKQIFSENKHESVSNIILQCDIEGAEWDLFQNMTSAELLKFKQIIVEFHDLDPSHDRFQSYLHILRKINQTHISIHVHFNNYSSITYIPGYAMLGTLLEITYIRKDDHQFVSKDDCYYPTQLDKINVTRVTDREIPIGYFNALVDRDERKQMGINPFVTDEMCHVEQCCYESSRALHIDALTSIVHNLHEMHKNRTFLDDLTHSSNFSDAQSELVTRFKDVLTLEQMAALAKEPAAWGVMRLRKNKAAKKSCALFVKKGGRFGNNFIKLINAIYLSKKLNVKYIVSDIVPSFKTGEHILDDDIVLSFTNQKKYNEYLSSIESTFYFHGMMFTPEQHGDFYINNGNNNIFHISSLLKSLLTIYPNDAVKETDLVVHFRSGDVFRTEPLPHQSYIQPPYAYYKKAVTMHLEAYPDALIYLVFEDRKNPCIKKLEEFLREYSVRYIVQSGTLDEDYSFFMNAHHVVSSTGTFLAPAIIANTKLKTIYSTKKIMVSFGAVQTVQDIHKNLKKIFIDATESYYKKMRPWINSEAQRQLMIDYNELIVTEN